jgi:DNA primase
MDAVDDIKKRLAIEDVVADYVQLRRAGRNFKGLSPFSDEKTPSFVVSPEKQIWHDFSSNKGGDMFTFVQEMEGVDFKGSLDILARKAGVDLEQYRNSNAKSNSKEKARLYDLLERATIFYQRKLQESELAIKYVAKREFNDATVETWRLGYAPANGKELVAVAKRGGFTQQELAQAGLTNRFGGDMFRNRLMIPLQDDQGRVIGFTARQLDADPNSPKYINTPQTLLYDKSRHVYGLHLAKQAIRKTKYVVLAEGNLDVIASHQAGVMQCVATAGTALTEPHLKTLKRLTGDIRLCFDADRAGIAATERAIPIASKVGVNLSIISIQNGKDPDELIRQDVGLWQQIIDVPAPAMDWLIRRYQDDLDLTTAKGKRMFRDVTLEVVRGLEDRGDQEHYTKLVAQITDVDPGTLIEMVLNGGEARMLQPTKRLASRPEHVARGDAKVDAVQDRLLALLLKQPKLRDIVEEIPDEYMSGEAARAMLRFLRAHPDFDGSAEYAPALKQVQNSENYVKILSLQYEELYTDVELLELRYEAERLQAQLVERYVKTQKQQIQEKLQSGTAGDEHALLQKDKALNELLRKYKGGK